MLTDSRGSADVLRYEWGSEEREIIAPSSARSLWQLEYCRFACHDILDDLARHSSADRARVR